MIGLPRARADVADACTYRQTDYRPEVREGAAQLLASWYSQAAGYGAEPELLDRLGDLAGVALDALHVVDVRRQLDA
jgi:hypothetical protein